MDKLRLVIQRALPLMEMLAALTANKYDDIVVRMLRELLGDDAMLATMAKRLEV